MNIWKQYLTQMEEKQEREKEKVLDFKKWPGLRTLLEEILGGTTCRINGGFWHCVCGAPQEEWSLISMDFFMYVCQSG